MEDTASVRPSVCFEVQKIIGVTIGNGNVRNYQVQWAPTWVSGFHLVGCEYLIEEFLQQESEKNQLVDGGIIATGATDTDVLQIDHKEDKMDVLYNVFESTSQQHSQVDTLERGSVGVNSELSFENQESNSCLYSNTSNDNGNVNVETNKGTNVSNKEICTTDRGASNQTNTNFECVKGEDMSSNEDEVVDNSEYTKEDNVMPLYRSSNNGKTTANVHVGDDNSTSLSLRCNDAYVNNDYVNAYEKDDGILLAGRHEKPHLINSDNEFRNNIYEVERGEVTLEEESETDQNNLGNNYKNSGTMVEHISSYTGDNVHKCIDCNKTFTNKSNLSAHLRLHAGIKPHKCMECDKAFSRKHHLKRHLRVHTGEKPFECRECYKAFTTKHSLTYHLGQYHGIIMDYSVSFSGNSSHI